VTNQEHFCRDHFSHAEPFNFGGHTEITGEFVKYDLARLHFSYEEDRFFLRLDPCEKQGRNLYVETGYIELSLVKHSLDRSLPTPTVHKLLVFLAQGMSLTVNRVIVADFTLTSRTFAAKIVLNGASCIQFDCRVSDGVALAMVSGCDLFVAKKVEQEYYSKGLPG